MASQKKARMQWYRVDLHLHTPASADYHDKRASYIDILRKAERRGLDIIAFTDHNTVNGYSAMMEEIERLRFLEQTGRALADELRLLAEYRRLLDKVLVLPGFEFTATFGFHVLGIFSPQTPIRYIEHLLFSLDVPPEVVEQGEAAAGATSDVLEAYRTIYDAGGLVIAAHANTTHGVAMRGLDFGGQTRIAYTQDRHLLALELTDLQRKGRGSSRRFFDGTTPGYPRRMHCVQGSDAHSIDAFQEGKTTRLGVGERVTEVLLPDRSFEALREMFESTDFSRTRPYNPNRQAFDFIQAAREEGPSLVQSFHENMERKGGHLHNVIADVCAFANTNGGTIYVGLSANKKDKPVGISTISEAIDTLTSEINRMITPELEVEIDTQETLGKSIIRLLVPYGEDRPYAINDNKIYVRDEADTSLAVRDEIVNLVKQGLVFQTTADTSEGQNSRPAPMMTSEPGLGTKSDPPAETDEIAPPGSGVEIVAVEERSDKTYYCMQDLRNGNTVKNVTRSSARRLWHYAISQWESNPVKGDLVQWQGTIGLWRSYKRGGQKRYDLVQEADNKVRIYYGVTESGMNGAWEQFLAPEDNNHGD